MSGGTLVGAALQVTGFLIVGWVLGNFLLDRALPAAEAEAEVTGWPERALAAIAGGLIFSVSVMALHVLSGGFVFSMPGVVPAIAILLVALLARRVRAPTNVPWRQVGAFVLLLVLIYVVPSVIGGSSIRSGDGPWHLGWTQQLLAGEILPTGPAPEFHNNAYPWGFHALLATLVRLVPGTDPLVAHEALQLIVIVSIPLAAAALARTARRDAGWAAAACVSLIGGFGWIAARKATFITSPADAEFGADLVVASPNAIYQLFAPPLPRELGLIMLAVAGWVLCLVVNDRSTAVAAGAAVGLVGLVSVPLFVSALVWMVASGVAFKRPLWWWVPAIVSAVAVFALWAAPVAAKYAAYGGFVDITPNLGVEWPLRVALSSWGLLLPLAVAGAAIVLRLHRPLFALVAGSLLLLGVAIARGHFGWTLGGNATLLHQGRAWPPMHLVAGVLGGVAITAAVAAYGGLKRPLVGTVLAGLFAVGAGSPVLASAALSETIHERRSGFVYSHPDVAPGSFVRRAGAELGPQDVVLATEDALAFFLFQFSGCRLARYDDPRLVTNDLRIRYRGLERQWSAQMAAGGFEPTHEVVPTENGPRRGAVVAEGTYAGRGWLLVEIGR